MPDERITPIPLAAVPATGQTCDQPPCVQSQPAPANSPVQAARGTLWGPGAIITALGPAVGVLVLLCWLSGLLNAPPKNPTPQAAASTPGANIDWSKAVPPSAKPAAARPREQPFDWGAPAAALGQDAPPAAARPREEPAKSTLLAPQDKRYVAAFDKKPWREVIDWFAEQTGLAFVGETLPAGTVTLAGPPGKTYSISGLVDLINDRLSDPTSPVASWLILVRASRTFTLVSASKTVPWKVVPSVDDGDLAKYGRTEVVRIQVVMKADVADRMVPSLKRKMSPFGEALAPQGWNRLILTDSVARLEAVLKDVDAVEESERKAKEDEENDAALVKHYVVSSGKARAIAEVVKARYKGVRSVRVTIIDEDELVIAAPESTRVPVEAFIGDGISFSVHGPAPLASPDATRFSTSSPPTYQPRNAPRLAGSYSPNTDSSPYYGPGRYYDPNYRPPVGEILVRGYYRSNGTWVAPYYRTLPDDSYFNNYEAPPNVNPHTWKPGNRLPRNRGR